MSENLKAFFFALGLCLVCSLVLTLASSGLRDYQQQNILLDRQQNLLKSVGLIAEGQRLRPADVQALYDRNIRMMWVGQEGNITASAQPGVRSLPLYLYRPEDEIIAYIVPIDTQGLWGRIYGYMAIAKDGSTVSGFTVYKHNETPGLGGEIEKQWFQKNFVGKRIVNHEGEFVSIAIAQGKVAERVRPQQQLNYVDGISGATLTGRYLTSGFREILTSYEPVSIRFRKNIASAAAEGGRGQP